MLIKSEYLYYRGYISSILGLSAFSPAIGFILLITRSWTLLNSYPIVFLVFLSPIIVSIIYFKNKTLKRADILAFEHRHLKRSFYIALILFLFFFIVILVSSRIGLIANDVQILMFFAAFSYAWLSVNRLAKTILFFNYEVTLFNIERSCILQADKNIEPYRTGLLIQSINWYEEYLKDNLKLGFRDVSSIYDTFFNEGSDEQIKSLALSFDRGKLEPLRVIFSNLKIFDKDRILTKSPFGPNK